MQGTRHMYFDWTINCLGFLPLKTIFLPKVGLELSVLMPRGMTNAVGLQKDRTAMRLVGLFALLTTQGYRTKFRSLPVVQHISIHQHPSISQPEHGEVGKITGHHENRALGIWVPTSIHLVNLVLSPRTHARTHARVRTGKVPQQRSEFGLR